MHAKSLRQVLVALLSLGIILGLSAAAPLSISSLSDPLDPTFGDAGKLLSTLGSQDIYARVVIVQPNQKLLVVGSIFAQDNWDFALLRYCPDGSLDDGINCGAPGFGAGGRVITNFGGSNHDSALDALLQPDGKIVVAGTSSQYPQYDMAVARYSANGILDASFDGDGLVKIDFQNSDERGYAVALQPDGKIVVGGVSYIATWGDFALARLCADGKLDDGASCGSPAFGTGGKLRTDFSGSSDWVSGVVVHAGKIIAGGSGGNKDFAVARYDLNGSLDPGFDFDGKRTFSFGSGWDYGQDVLVQPDGKIILAGGGYAADWNTDFGLVRFNENGSLDTTFGVEGKILTEFNGYSDRILSLALQADNKILAAGYASHCSGEDLAIVRYDTHGVLDATFAGDGALTTEFGGYYDAAYSVAVQANGKVVLAGNSDDDLGGENIALLRYNPDGSLDNSFDGDGKVTTGSLNAHQLGRGIAASAGKILVAGAANNNRNNDFALARFQDDGSLDSSFAINGVGTADFSAGDDLANAISVQNDGKIVLAGYTIQGGNVNFAVARFCPDGKLDNGANCGTPGFGVGGKSTADFGGSDYAQAVTVQPGGGIVVAGYSRTCPNSDFAVARFKSDGSLDSGFSGDGKTTTDFSGDWDDGMGVASQPDGKLVVVGSSAMDYYLQDFAVARYCPNGSLDDGANCGSPGFGLAGKLTVDIAGDADSASAVAVQPDGKIVIAGNAYASSSDFALLRLCANGQIDDGVNCGAPAFGVGGKTITDFFADWDSLSAMLLMPGGKILCAGEAFREITNGWDQDYALVFFNADGSLDQSFSDDGLETIDFASTDDTGKALAMQADGKILVSGDSAGRLAIARLIHFSANIYLPVIQR